jgi:mRNA interferase RelE/StbE
MIKYRVLWDREALSDLKKLDKIIAKKIVEKIADYLAVDPLNLGKKLTGNLRGLMRYRFGDYQIIYEVMNNEISVVIVRVSHRKGVYET